MTKKKEDNKDEYQRLIIVEREYEYSYPLRWKHLPKEVMDNIPSFLIYNTPCILPSGEIEMKTVVYVEELWDEYEEDLVENDVDLSYYDIPERKVTIVIPG